METFFNGCIAGVNDLGRGFCAHAAGMFVQSGVLIVVLLITDLLLHRHIRATVRYWIWMLVIVKLLVPPTFSLPTGVGHWLGPYVAPPAPAARQILGTAGSYETPRQTASPVMLARQSNAGVAAARAEPVTSVAVPGEHLTWQGSAVLLWGIGVLGFTVLVLRRVSFVRRLAAQGRPAQGDAIDLLDECRRRMNIRRSVRMKLLPGAFSPAVCGLWRPTILLPQTLPARLTPDGLRTVLIHELAHVKRADLWVNCVQTILQIVYFYNPLVWLANAIVRRVREQAVDEMSLVALGAEARSYSPTLIDVAEMALGRASPALGLVGVAESKKSLEGRIRHMITRPIPKTARVGVRGLAAILLAAAVLLPMAHAQNHAKQTAEPVGAQTDPNLVGWWKLDDGIGTVVTDSSSNGIDGNFVGNPIWVAGMHDGALLFDGASSVDFGSPRKTAITGPLTIACWIKPQNLGTIARVVGGSQDRAFLARDGAYAFKASGPNLRFTTPWIRDHEAPRTFLTEGQWQHVAVTFQPDEIGGCVFYLDGVESDRDDASILDPGTGPVRIAENQWPGGQFYTGLIDDVRLYSRVLTADEIKAVMGSNLFARDPQPADGASVSLQDTATLSWSPGDRAVQHDVYLGLDEESVKVARPMWPQYMGRQSGTSFSVAEKLTAGAVYFWRIDEVEADVTTVRKGTVWTFTIAK
jgi:beta-lactamase regulating signal transducer with metallopeptidase domain